MPVFAILKNSIVENTIIGDELGVVQLFFPDNEVVEVTETTGDAYIGGDFTGQQFRPIQPYPSWTWSIENLRWNPPTEYPSDGLYYVWDEESKSWSKVDPIVVSNDE